MNLCILIGKIISKIEFKFIINSKHKSIACFALELSNKSIVKVIAYNDVADYIYQKIYNKDIIEIEGKIKTNGIIEAEKIISKKLLTTIARYGKINNCNPLSQGTQKL